ncbi:MAG: hypothetical protein C0412_01135 [Flavobacterium sp.]|nr:hypothetical protein [Flavobacterium sp.]
MQLKKIFSLFLIAIVFNLILTNCKKDDSPTDSTEGQTGQGVITSLGSGQVSTSDGFKINVIPGAVPANQSGASASVTFSIETKVTPTKALPSTATVRSDFVKLGPDGFVFRWPVKVTIPFTGADASDIKVLYLNTLLDKWVIIPANEIDNTAKTVSVDVLSLGYFCAATISSGFNKISAEDSDGGFEFATSDNTYYYTLTVGGVTNWKYPSQTAWYSNIIGSSGSTGSQPTGGPRPPTHIHLPQATYTIWVARTTPGTLSTLPKVEFYSQPVTGTIAQPVTYSGPLSTGQGWTSLGFPSGGSWSETRPANWGTPTVTYGTGDFQATLTWVNSPSANSDVDLHLIGPNSMHVFYRAKTSSDGSLQLDVDKQRSNSGITETATENIYSLSTMPSGQYKVYVNLYVGAANNFNVRIVRFGTVKTFTGTVSTQYTGDDPGSTMVLVDTFTK